MIWVESNYKSKIFFSVMNYYINKFQKLQISEFRTTNSRDIINQKHY